MNRPSLDNAHWKSPGRFLQWQERLVHFILATFAVITILTTIGILVVLGTETYRFFLKADTSPLEFLTNRTLEPEASPPKFGIVPLIWGTMVVTFGCFSMSNGRAQAHC